MNLFCRLFLGAAFAASAAVWADDDVVKDPIDTPQAVSRWYNAKAMQFLPNGGPEGKPAVKLVSTDVKKGVGCELQLDIEKIRGKLVEVTADIKGENVTQPPKPYLGVKLMFRVDLADGKIDYPDIAPAAKQIGSFDWTEYKVKTRIPADAKSARLVIGLQESTGTVCYSDLEIEVED